MLKDFLAHNIDRYEGEVKHYIMNYRSKDITGTIFYTYKEYQNYLQIYRSNKSQYHHSLEAFVSLWISALIDEEEWYDLFEPNIKSADDIYNNWFKKEINQYTFHHVTTNSLREYVLSKANKMKELVKEYRQKNPLIKCRIIYPSSIPGIYINRDMQDEQEYTLNLSKNVIVAEELSSYDNWAGYKEIFIETEQEYIYFRE
jgi:hypothetical protein